MKILTQQIEKEIAMHRDTLVSNLFALSLKSTLPLPTGHPNTESSVSMRLRELQELLNEQHARMHQLKALKNVLKKIKRLERTAP